MALERGQLQNLVFDQQAHLSHRAMAAILGVILKLPPVKQALASEQLRSRYLEALLRANPSIVSSPRAGTKRSGCRSTSRSWTRC